MSRVSDLSHPPCSARGTHLGENAEDGGLKGLFAEMDEDGSGALDEGEVGLLLGKLGYELDEKALAKLVAEMDEDGNGEIDFHEFKQWFVGHVSKNAALLEFQQKRQRAHRIAARSGVRHGPVWDVKAAQATQKQTGKPALASFDSMFKLSGIS